MATARDLIKSSLRVLGVIASGENISAQEAQDGLEALNQMLSSWSTEKLLIFASQKENFPFLAGKQSYTMGPSGDFDTVRPQKVEQAYVLLPDGVETPLKILNQAEWAAVTLKNVASDIPRYLYVEDTYPLSTLNFWTKPASSALSVNLYSWKPLTGFLSLNDDIVLPPGYERALKYNLALEIAPEFGLEPSASIIASATEAKANIKRMNIKPHYLVADSAVGTAKGAWDWRTGDYK